MDYIKLFESFNSTIDEVNKKIKNLFKNKTAYMTLAGGILIPVNVFNKLDKDSKKYLKTSIGMSLDYAMSIIEEHENNKKNTQSSKSINNINSEEGESTFKNMNYYFLRWTDSPSNDVDRNFSGHMGSWVETEEAAFYMRDVKYKNRHFPHKPKYDKNNDLWNYDPEWGVSGYLFKDENSYIDAMKNISEISWYHKEAKGQDLALFGAESISKELGHDGEQLFRGLKFIKYIDEETPYEEIKKIIS